MLYLFPDQSAEHHQSVVSIFRPGLSKTDADTIVIEIPSCKNPSRCYGDMVFPGFGTEREAVDLSRQFNP